jgi:integrating conjugative element membrane protein (TIGR03747 family)
MSGDSSASPHSEPGRRTFVGWLVTLPLQGFGFLCGSLLLAILIECIGVHWLWPEESWHHARKMFEFEFAQLSHEFTQSLLSRAPAQAAEDLIACVFQMLFVDSGLLEKTSELAERAREHAAHGTGFKHWLSALYIDIGIYARASGYIVLTFLARLAVLTLTLPLFALAAFVGLIDGLVRRDKRRFGAVYESGFIHHRARAFILPLALLPWGVYLALPISVYPLAILLPSAVLLGVAVNLTAASFKKYL